jgi:hypothetical protein
MNEGRESGGGSSGDASYGCFSAAMPMKSATRIADDAGMPIASMASERKARRSASQLLSSNRRCHQSGRTRGSSSRMQSATRVQSTDTMQ